MIGERETYGFWEVEITLDEAIKRERERCAKIAEGWISPTGAAIAKKIREQTAL